MASDAERKMRDLVVAWGRKRWPGARVVHEMKMGDCRADVAFVDTHHLAVVEVKSPKDSLTRIARQFEVCGAHCHEFWIALAPKWVDKLQADHFRGAWSYANKMIVDDEVRMTWGERANHVDRSVTVPLLRLLWNDELADIGRRHQIIQGPTKARTADLVATLARLLTGQEIIAGACAQLRARSGGRMGPAFGKGTDPAIAIPEKTRAA